MYIVQRKNGKILCIHENLEYIKKVMKNKSKRLGEELELVDAEGNPVIDEFVAPFSSPISGKNKTYKQKG